MSVWGGSPSPPLKNRFLTHLQNTRWKWLLGAVFTHFLGPGAQGPFLDVFRELFYTKLVCRSVCIHFLGQGGQTHTSIHTLCKQISAISTFSRYLPGKNTTIFENRPFLKRHGTVSVWVYVYFSSVFIGGKGPYTHTLTSSPQLFLMFFCTFWSKTRCLSAKLDTLTSKQIGVCSKNVVFCP